MLLKYLFGLAALTHCAQGSDNRRWCEGVRNEVAHLADIHQTEAKPPKDCTPVYIIHARNVPASAIERTIALTSGSHFHCPAHHSANCPPLSRLPGRTDTTSTGTRECDEPKWARSASLANFPTRFLQGDSREVHLGASEES